MTRCNITVTTRVVNPGYSTGLQDWNNLPRESVAFCTTHSMPLETMTNDLCPIGRIEEATEKALEQIGNTVRLIEASR